MTRSANCPPTEQLSRLLAGSLSPEAQGDLTGHLDDCPHCRQELERLAGGVEGWRETARKLGAACARTGGAGPARRARPAGRRSGRRADAG